MTEINLYETREYMVTTAHYLADQGFTAQDIAYFVEKPWKYEDEYNAALKLREREDEV
jgi:hypothetical protein